MRNPEQAALPANRERPVGAIEQFAAVRNAHLPDLRAKKIPPHRQLPDLGVQLLDLARSCASSNSRPTLALEARAAYSRSCFFQA
jgi:hypothetical protein